MKATFTWSEETGETKATFELDGEGISVLDFLKDAIEETTAKYNEKSLEIFGWGKPR